MRCTNCGNEVSCNEKICANCGENNADYVAPYQPPPPQQYTQSYGINWTANTAVSVIPSAQSSEKYEKFAKAGLILGILSAVFFAIILILTISIIDDAVSPYPDAGALYLKLIWVGLLFISAMIIGILGIIFSSVSLREPNGKRRWSITGLVLSCVFTAICIILYLIGLSS